MEAEAAAAVLEEEEASETEEDLEEEMAEDLREDLQRCIMLYATNARKNARFHLNHQIASLFTAVIASGLKKMGVVMAVILTQDLVLAQEARADLLSQGYLQNSSTRLTQSLTR